jgi:DUF971 family protein
MSEPRDIPVPIELRAPRGAVVMEVVWSDGVTTTFSHRLLRGFCPCAYCQGHQGPIQWSEGAPADDVLIDEIEEVGLYALRLGWADGHTTGIYSFRFLRELAPLAELPLDDAKTRSFGR